MKGGYVDMNAQLIHPAWTLFTAFSFFILFATFFEYHIPII